MFNNPKQRANAILEFDFTSTPTPRSKIVLRQKPRELHSYASLDRMLASMLPAWERAMIEAFSLRTAHLFQDALASQARLRYLRRTIENAKSAER
jgi:hypothetical protein